MSRGAILFAFNSPKYDYYSMAEFTAKRINHYLDLPVTIITDKESTLSSSGYQFDNVIITEPDKDKSNKRSWGLWINKGRYQVYDMTPYDDTILLDADYIVNSDQLKILPDITTDFLCHYNTSYLMAPDAGQESVCQAFDTVWATVISFKKTKLTQQIFNMMEMIQNNYEHYSNIYHFLPTPYRNDYSLTIALRTVYGHLLDNRHKIPWNLVHVGTGTKIYRDSDNEYTIVYDKWQRGKIKKEYITIKDCDFHVQNKELLEDIMNV